MSANSRGKRGNYQFLTPVSPVDGEYTLTIRQQPVKAKVSSTADKTGSGEKKTIDPAIIVELHIKDKSDTPAASDPVHYLYNPFLFAYATLLNPDTLEEIPYLDDTMHILTGSIASCVYHLKDPENNNRFGAFFVFPDIAIRQEGTFQLKISLFKISGGGDDPVNVPSRVTELQSVNTDRFHVYSLKAFPPLLPSSVLSKSFADQGLKLRLRKNPKSQTKDGDDDSTDNDSPSVTGPSNDKKAPAPYAGRRPPEWGPSPYYYRPPPPGYGPPPPGYGYPTPSPYGYPPYPYPYPPGPHPHGPPPPSSAGPPGSASDEYPRHPAPYGYSPQERPPPNYPPYGYDPAYPPPPHYAGYPPRKPYGYPPNPNSASNANPEHFPGHPPNHPGSREHPHSGPNSAREHPSSAPPSARDHPHPGPLSARDHPSGHPSVRDHPSSAPTSARDIPHSGPPSAPLSSIHASPRELQERSPSGDSRKESPDHKRPILPSRLGMDDWDRDAKRPRVDEDDRHLPAVHQHGSAPNSASSLGPPLLARRSSIPGQERYPLPPPNPYWQSGYPPGYRPPPRPYAAAPPPGPDRHFPPPQSHYAPSGGYPPYDGRYHPGGPPADYRKREPPYYPGHADKKIKTEDEGGEIPSSQNGTNDDE